ncbi:tail fiber protein, partial [Vibrio parahaemolyticus]|uniref:tail fiber protein n=1 Tax=Vibrio parahaemolyticus TaxID=670 RepID=UPI001D169053
MTDSTSSTSSILVASAKAIKTVKDLAQSKWTYVTATVSRYGAVLLSNSYTGTSQTKAVTEKALRDGLATKSSSGHAHDEDYYLKAQLDSKLADKLSKTAKATLTDNDGHGNANLVGNHQGGIPQQDGSSYRVEMGTDTNVANLSIELGDSVRAGIAKALTTVLYLCTSYIDSKVDLRERGARVFSPNNRNISSQTDGSNDLIYASQKAVGDSSRNGST